MTRVEKIVVAAVVALFIVMAVVLIRSLQSGESSFSDSVIIQQRVINVEKSR